MAEHKEREVRLKKKLAVFLSDLTRVATVKGFLFLQQYVRGKEELVVSIVNHPQGGGVLPVEACAGDCTTLTHSSSPASSFTSGNLPYDKRLLLLSQRSQRSLSGYGDVGVGLPPASPSDTESHTDTGATLFLVAGYGRYSCPYVWLRSNHQRVVNLSDADRDDPLKLKSTANWLKEDIRVWDILGELVRLCTYPAPLNPYSVDHAYFSALPLAERVLGRASMIHVLQQIVVTASADRPHTPKVLEDIHRLTKDYFCDLSQLGAPSSPGVHSPAASPPSPPARLVPPGASRRVYHTGMF